MKKLIILFLLIASIGYSQHNINNSGAKVYQDSMYVDGELNVLTKINVNQTSSGDSTLNVGGGASITGGINIDGNTFVVNNSSNRVGIGDGADPTWPFQIGNGSTTSVFSVANETSGSQIHINSWASGMNLQQLVDGQHLYINRDSPSNTDLYLGRAGQDAIIDGATGNITTNGTFAPGTIAGDAAPTDLFYDGSNVLVFNSSDRRVKKNIKDINIDSVIYRIENYRPRTFEWKDTNEVEDSTIIWNPSRDRIGKKWTGFIAQELNEINSNAVNYSDECDLYGISEERLIPDLVSYVQYLSNKIEILYIAIILLIVWCSVLTVLRFKK